MTTAFESLETTLHEATEEARRLKTMITGEGLLPALERAADAWVSEVERREAAGAEPLALDLAEAFLGLVVEAAMRRQNHREEHDRLRAALVKLGRGKTVTSRNHVAVWGRYQMKVSSLRDALKHAPQKVIPVSDPAAPLVRSVEPGERDAAVMQ